MGWSVSWLLHQSIGLVGLHLLKQPAHTSAIGQVAALLLDQLLQGLLQGRGGAFFQLEFRRNHHQVVAVVFHQRVNSFLAEVFALLAAAEAVGLIDEQHAPQG